MGMGTSGGASHLVNHKNKKRFQHEAFNHGQSVCAMVIGRLATEDLGHETIRQRPVGSKSVSHFDPGAEG